MAESYARLFGRSGHDMGVAAARGVAGTGFALELFHHLLPGDDWLVGK